jgi:hypothetical protein
MTITLTAVLYWTVWALVTALPLLVAFIFWLGHTSRKTIIAFAIVWLLTAALAFGWALASTHGWVEDLITIGLFAGVIVASISLFARRIRPWITFENVQKGANWRVEPKPKATTVVVTGSGVS